MVFEKRNISTVFTDRIVTYRQSNDVGKEIWWGTPVRIHACNHNKLSFVWWRCPWTRIRVHLPASFNNVTASSIFESVVLGIKRISSQVSAITSFLTCSNITSACLRVGEGLILMPNTLRASKVSFKASKKFPRSHSFRERRRRMLLFSSGALQWRRHSCRIELEASKSPEHHCKETWDMVPCIAHPSK